MALYPPSGIGEFRQPKVTAFTLTSNAAKLIAAGSSNRVVLVVGLSNSTFSVAVSPSPTVSVGKGILLSSTFPLVITWEQHGPLVNLDWYAIGSTGGQIEVWELFYQPTRG